MNRKIQTKSIAMVVLATAISCAGLHKEENNLEYPNIILLMGDDHGWDEVGYNGHPFVKTPVLDEMAGISFEQPDGSRL